MQSDYLSKISLLQSAIEVAPDDLKLDANFIIDNSKIGKDLPFFHQLLKDTKQSSEIRSWVASALGQIGAPESFEYLLDIILNKSTERHILYSAIISLGKLRNPLAYTLLVKVFQEEKDYYIRYAAAQGLGELGIEAAITPLSKALSEEKEEGLLMYILRALWRIGNEEALEILENLLDSENVYLCELSAWLLELKKTP